jgi:beta-phosphoglucomutase family hydrolase
MGNGYMSEKQLRKYPHAHGLIFDLDGTIADTMPLHFRAWRFALESYDINFSHREFYAFAGMPTHVILTKLQQKHHRPVPEHEVMRCKDDYFLRSLDEIEIINPVFSVVTEWYGSVPLGIGTGGRRAIVNRTIDVLGIRKYFESIITVEDVRNPKPHPDTFIQCAQKLGVEPRFCQVFEDGDTGLQAARDAGMYATDVRPFITSERWI